MDGVLMDGVRSGSSKLLILFKGSSSTSTQCRYELIVVQTKMASIARPTRLTIVVPQQALEYRAAVLQMQLQVPLGNTARTLNNTRGRPL